MKKFSLVLFLAVCPLLHATDSTMTLVIGLPRSGTSCLTGVLHELGLFVGEHENLKPADENNEKGYFENMPLMYLNEKILKGYDMTVVAPFDIDFPSFELFKSDVEQIKETIQAQFGGAKHILFKDVRTVFMLPFYLEAAKQLGYSPKFVVIRRDLVSAMESGKAFKFSPKDIEAMGEEQIAQIHDSTSPVIAKMKVHFEKEIGKHLRGKCQLIEIEYSDLCECTQATVAKLGEFFSELNITEDQVHNAVNFVDPALRHHRGYTK